MPSLPRRDGTTSPTGSPRYDALFANGVVSVMFGVGFDEDGANRAVDTGVEEALLARGFARDDALAVKLLRDSGREAPRAFAAHYVARGAVPEFNGAPVDAVLTLVRAGDGTAGEAAATAFTEGLERCDIAIYGGHGRYGTGPDFDYNFSAEIVDDKGAVEMSFRAYKDLEEELARQGRPKGRSALAQYRHLREKGRLRVQRVNGGNLVVNLRNYHAGEFGSHLMVDQLAADEGARRVSKLALSKRYRVWLLHGCRTSDYLYNLRGSLADANAAGLDLFVTRRVIYWDDIKDTLVAFYDGLVRRCTARELLEGMNVCNRPYENERDADSLGESHVADLSAPGGER